jgi:predicted acyl esterase
MQKTHPPYLFRPPLARPEEKGGAPPDYRRSVEDGALIEKDVAIALRDGVRIYADIFRPADETPAPPIIAWGPYGKHGHTRYGANFPKADVDDDRLSKYTAFEAPDALHWVKHGYAVINVDPRGTWYSEGDATYLSPEEAQDFCDVIEWAGVQPWSNGKVGLSGVSYLTSSQWRVAELNPPHLAAINPWEGWTDTYREVARHGGIPETSFWPYLPTRWGHGVNQVEDLRTETAEHPFYDDFWRSKTADFSKITVPAYVVASWTDQGLHTRGTLEGFKHIRSERKWLEVHGRKKWYYYYEPDSVRRQIAFFDHFLKGEDTEIAAWPKVQLEVRKSYNIGDFHAETEWPLARTRHVPLYLDAASGRLSREAAPTPSSLSYDATAPADQPGRATFDFVFDERTELVGHMKLKLFVSTDAGDDMDLFVAIQKLGPNGEIVPFAYYAQFEDGPVALGWLRVSHRELDADASTPFQPVLKHQRELKIEPGEIVPVEIEIWPSGTLFEPGSSLRVVVQGRDIYDYPKPSVYARHEALVNQGWHTIHTGGKHDSYLLIPLIPD